MRTHHLAMLLCVILVGSLLGCFPHGIGDPEKSTMDPKYLGAWLMTSDRQDQIWFVHKLDARGYLVQTYTFSRGDDMSAKLENGPTVCRAWLTPVGETTFVSMEVIGPELAISPDSDASRHRFIVARVALDGQQLTVRPLAPDFFKDKAIDTPEKFEQVIKDSLDDEKMYLPTQTFSRVTKNTQGVQELLDLIK